jgi:hypothetical protein
MGLRLRAVVVVLACWATSALAEPTPLNAVDRELNALCLRLPKVSGAEAASVRAQLAAGWRRREAIIEALSSGQSAPRSGLNRKCYLVAEAEAAKSAAGASNTAKSTGGAKKKAKRAPSVNHYYRAARPSNRIATDVPAWGGAAPTSGGSPHVVPLANRNSSFFHDAIATVGPPGASEAPMGPTAAPTQPHAPLTDLFPWPPPVPSDRVTYGLPQLASTAPLSTLGAVSDHLEKILRKGGYRSWAYFNAPKGFALVAPVEALDAQGQVLSGNARWSHNPQLAVSSLTFWQLLTLRQRPVGHYRLLLFIVTPESVIGDAVSGPQMWEHAERWANTGLAFLPAQVRKTPVTADYHLVVNVYEFERSLAGETKMAVHAAWPMAAHLQSAGIVIETRP